MSAPLREEGCGHVVHLAGRTFLFSAVKSGRQPLGAGVAAIAARSLQRKRAAGGPGRKRLLDFLYVHALVEGVLSAHRLKVLGNDKWLNAELPAEFIGGFREKTLHGVHYSFLHVSQTYP